MRFKINFFYLQKEILLAISLASFIGALVYLVYSFNTIGLGITFIFALFTYIIIQFWRHKNNAKAKKAIEGKGRIPVPSSRDITSYIFQFIYLILAGCCFLLLYKNQTSIPIISPWQVLPNYFFWFYSAATLLLILAVLSNPRLSLFMVTLHYLLSLSVATIIYQLGYGFDSFIHRATIGLIDQAGQVLPKPFYYLGQYSLILMLHKLTFLPIAWLDKWLVPILSAIFLPVAIKELLKNWFSHKKNIYISLVFVLAIPFTIFISTTPQNLAFLFLLLLVIYSLQCKNHYDLLFLYSLALAAMASQPIAGIPALFLVFFITVYHGEFRYKKSLYAILFSLLSLALTASFYIVEKTQSAIGQSNNDQPVDNLFKFILPGQENVILNFIYLYAFNIKAITALTITAGIIIALKHRKDCQALFVYLLPAASLLSAYVLIKQLPFAFLIDYERKNFTDRILINAVIISFPFVLVAIYGWVKKILEQTSPIKFIWLIFLISLVTASLYFSYPRFDRYHNSHGYSVSQSDIKAVRWIDSQASLDYIVLANQQVSAAALREFGFKKYYQPTTLQPYNTTTQIFYYPIPTGGPLYQYYLDMVYRSPSRETMVSALDLVGVDEAYFVLNKYWWAFDKVLAEAKLSADSFEEIDNGEVYVFKYNL